MNCGMKHMEKVKHVVVHAVFMFFSFNNSAPVPYILKEWFCLSIPLCECKMKINVKTAGSRYMIMMCSFTCNAIIQFLYQNLFRYIQFISPDKKINVSTDPHPCGRIQFAKDCAFQKNKVDSGILKNVSDVLDLVFENDHTTCRLKV